MGKASRKKKSGKKYYYQDFKSRDSRTIKSIYADSDEEAYDKIKELLGHEDFSAGQLPHSQTRQEIAELRKWEEEMAEKFMPGGAEMMRNMRELA